MERFTVFWNLSGADKLPRIPGYGPLVDCSEILQAQPAKPNANISKTFIQILAKIVCVSNLESEAFYDCTTSCLPKSIYYCFKTKRKKILKKGLYMFTFYLLLSLVQHNNSLQYKQYINVIYGKIRLESINWISKRRTNSLWTFKILSLERKHSYGSWEKPWLCRRKSLSNICSSLLVPLTPSVFFTASLEKEALCFLYSSLMSLHTQYSQK